ncbi:tail protein X [Rickettsiales bacterium]|nr:tail protein X [Rickettsiales bacterium]
MSIIYTTRDGDVLDQICQNYYGSKAKIVEQVLEANPHLSNLDAVFEAGVKITLPEVTIQKESEIVKLWT